MKARAPHKMVLLEVLIMNVVVDEKFGSVYAELWNEEQSQDTEAVFGFREGDERVGSIEPHADQIRLVNLLSRCKRCNQRQCPMQTPKSNGKRRKKFSSAAAGIRVYNRKQGNEPLCPRMTIDELKLLDSAWLAEIDPIDPKPLDDDEFPNNIAAEPSESGGWSRITLFSGAV